MEDKKLTMEQYHGHIMGMEAIIWGIIPVEGLLLRRINLGKKNIIESKENWMIGKRYWKLLGK